MPGHDMDIFFEKISSYNILNYLIPGAVLETFVRFLFGFTLAPEDIIPSLVFFYFLGLVASRFGSLFLEPVLKFLNLVPPHNYHGFLKAAKKDPKLEVLSEANNMYRTFLSVFTLLGLALLFNKINLSPITHTAAVSFAWIIFFMSHRKQSFFIQKRIRGLGKTK